MKKGMMVVIVAIFLASWFQPLMADGNDYMWVKDFAFGQNTLYLMLGGEIVDVKLEKIESIRLINFIPSDAGEIRLALCPKGIEILYNAHGQSWLPPSHNCGLYRFEQELYELFLKFGEEKGIEIIPFK